MLYDSPGKPTPAEMRLYKSAVVSGDLLAFLSLGIQSPQGIGLWGFVYVPRESLVIARRELQKRYELGLKDRIQGSLDLDPHYPWSALSVFDADMHGNNRYLADVVKAIVGAIYIDSGGDLDAVTGVVERLGILKVLRRLVKDSVNVVHPVTRLEEKLVPLRKGHPKYTFWFDGEHICSIRFDGRVLAGASSPISKFEARARAAEKGIEELARTEESIAGW
ncbi:hypothetical protein DFP73DRAFT_558189 [Morchella snyderi]|nr:hypothetical protein DFP73DRAFT_558189 [Morchella snyderi]